VESPEKVQLFHRGFTRSAQFTIFRRPNNMLEWDAISSNHASTESADFQALSAMFDPVMEAPPSAYHVFFDANFPEMVKAPINEVVTFYGPDEDFEAFDFENLAVLFRAGYGFGGFSTGAAVEELMLGEDKFKAYNLLAGWESLKAHTDTFARSEVQEGMTKFGSAFQGLKGNEIHHVKLVSG